VSPDYPRSMPVFALLVRWKTNRTALNDEDVREMEANINVHCVSEVRWRGEW